MEDHVIQERNHFMYSYTINIYFKKEQGGKEKNSK